MFTSEILANPWKSYVPWSTGMGSCHPTFFGIPLGRWISICHGEMIIPYWKIMENRPCFTPDPAYFSWLAVSWLHAILAKIAAAEEVVLDTMDLRICKNGRPKALKICDHHLPCWVTPREVTECFGQFCFRGNETIVAGVLLEDSINKWFQSSMLRNVAPWQFNRPCVQKL